MIICTLKSQGNTFHQVLSMFCCCCLFTKSCPTFCDPMDCSSPGSSVHGISQARILEWIAISSSTGSSQPRDQTQVSCLAGRFFTTEPPGKPHEACLSCVLPLILKIHPWRVLNLGVQTPMRLRWDPTWISIPMLCYAKSLQSCPTLCDPTDGSPPGSPVPGIFQARTLEWVAISFSNAWKGKVKVKSLSRDRLLATRWTAAYQAPLSMGFSKQEYWSGVPLPSPTCIQNLNYMYVHFCLSSQPGIWASQHLGWR